jgi:hypothetical protein
MVADRSPIVNMGEEWGITPGQPRAAQAVGEDGQTNDKNQ